MVKIPLHSNEKNRFTSFDNGDCVVATFKLDSIVLNSITKNKQEFQRITAPGLYSNGEIGAPELPAFKKLIEIPEGADAEVKIVKFYSQILYLENKGIDGQIFPVQPSKPKVIPMDTGFVCNDKAYRSNIGNKPIVKLEILGKMRGIQIARLTVEPMQYDPQHGLVKIFNDIEVNINFTDKNTIKKPIVKGLQSASLFTPIFSKIMQVSGYPEHPDLTKYPVKYLIVAPDSFSNALQPFIRWKTQQGYQVIQGYLNSIGTTTTAIQAWIQDHYNNATGTGFDQIPTYLLIVGDIQQVPAFVGSRTGLYTDLYYASVDGDYFPDIYYGRFSVVNTSQLSAIIEKTLYYEKYQFDQPEYLDRVTLIAGVDATYNPSHGRPSIRYARDNYFNTANGFDTLYFYESTYTDCYSTIDTGIGFINYTAHGSSTSWSNPSFSTTNVGNLTNYNKYPFVVGNCCLSGNFGYSECFGEKWIRASQKGGVVYIGSAPESYWDEDVFWSVGAFPFVGDGTTPLYSETTMGAYDASFTSDYVSAGALMFVGNLAVTEADVQNYPGESSPEYYWQGYNLLGDPSLAPYFKQGLQNTVNHLEYFPEGASWFEISALPGSYVGISSDTLLLGAAFVDSSGNVNIPVIDTFDISEVMVTVTKAQYQPYFDSIPVINPEGPYIHLKSFEVDDTLGGNANALAEYQESIMLDVTLINLGKQPASGDVEVTITTSDPYILTIDSIENFGLIDTTDGLDVVHVENGFMFYISNLLPDQHKATFHFKATDGDSIWSSDFTKILYAPVISYTGFTINDSLNGNLDGVIDPGEEVSLNITISNTGNSPIGNIVATLVSDEPYLTIINTIDSVVNINQGDSRNATFNILVSASVPANYVFDLPLFVSGGSDNQYVYYDTLHVNANYTPVYLMKNGSMVACRGLFYDSGGETGNYTNNENLTFTIYPCYAGQAVAVEFTEFSTESGYDYLYIYNGSGTGSPQIEGSPFNSTNGPGYLVADNAEGSLTFRFNSDGGVMRPGWEANITCIDPTVVPECASLKYPAKDTSQVIPMVKLEWDFSPGALQYYVYFDTSGTLMTFLDSTSDCSLNLPGMLKPYTTYYWKVIPSNHAGFATGCEVWSFTTGPEVILHSTDTLVICDGYYFDNGGPNSNYSNNQNQTLVFIPASEGYRISVEFHEFNTESGYDYLYIYDSSSMDGPQITGSPFTGTSSPGTVTGYNDEGALTFRFVSDFSDARSGWYATVRCKPVLLSVEASAASGSIFRGDSVQLYAFADGGLEAYAYKWKSMPYDSSLLDSTIANPYVKPKVNTKYTVSVNDGDSIVYDSVLVEVRDYTPQIVIPSSSADTILIGMEVLLSASVTGGSQHYQYLWRANPFDSSMVDTTHIDVQTFPIQTTDYTLYVDDGYTVQDSTIQVTVLKPTLNFLPLSDEIRICSDDTVNLAVLYTGGYGTVHFLWHSIPQDISLLDSTSYSIEVSPGHNTWYFISLSDKYQTLQDSVSVIVNDFPSAPLLSLMNDTLIISTYNGINRWFVNDTLIDGQDGNELIPSKDGLYHVIADYFGCLSDPSNTILINFTGIRQIINDDLILRVIPNPFNDHCEISLGDKNIDKAELFDLTGKRVRIFDNIRSNSFELFEGELKGGIYTIKVYSDKMVYIAKVVMY